MKEIKMAIIGAVLIGFSSGILVNDYIAETLDDKEAVVEEYTVKPRDTMFTISEKYREKDCRDPYILEYKYELEKLNPSINPGLLRVGDKIKIVYYVPKEKM